MQFPLDRALERDVLQPRDPEIERRIPRPPKPLRTGRAPQGVAIALRHVHHPRRARDAAGVGERLDECFLPFRRPAIMTIFARDGREVWQRRARGVGDGGAVLHRQGS